MKKDPNKKIIDIAIERWKESSSAETDMRANSSHDTEFGNGAQWSEDEEKEREGRPCPVVNKVNGSIKQITGDAQQSTPDIKVRPVDSQGDPIVAEFFGGLIRDIEQASDAASVYDHGFDCSVRGGIGYWRVLTDYVGDDTFDQEIRIRRIVNPQSVYMDQSAVEETYEDIEYGFICETISRDKYEDEHGKEIPANWEQSQGEEMSGWFADDGVRIAEYYYKEYYKKHLFELEDGKVIEIRKPETTDIEGIKLVTGNVLRKNEDGDLEESPLEEPLVFRRTRSRESHKVMWCKLSGDEVLEGPNEHAGRYIPIIPILGEEVWINGQRVLNSAIRHAIDSQKLYNWSRANSIETLALGPKQPYFVTPEEIDGHETQWDEAHIRPQPYRLFNEAGLGRPQPAIPGVANNAANKEAMMAADDIKSTIGLFDASLGARGNETSGIAIEARRSQASTSTYGFINNRFKAIKYTARILIDLIPKIYDTERVVRILNQEGQEAWIRINAVDETGQRIGDDLSVGRYDVVLDVGPGYMTKRLEAADGMAKLAQTAPNYAPILIPEIAKNLDWPGADKIAQQMQSMNQPPPPDPEKELDVQKAGIEVEGKAKDIEGKAIENEGKKIELAIKAQELQDARIDDTEKMYKIAQKAVVDTLRQLGVQ